MPEYDRSEERTGFQESRDYDERYDIQADFVMVYGLHNLRERISHWKKHGYKIHLMTGISWGNYKDYLYGKYDGRDHHDEGQMTADGKEKNHGPDVPYMVPSVSFAGYMAKKLKTAIDAGVEAIHLEEPEFWVENGYSDAFQREWEIFFKEPWQDPQATCEGQYKASKLKQYLYTRTLDRLCAELKEYSLIKYGRIIRFYVPTHSLINYSQWKIVSPESALLDLPAIDGYIAQIWTGTSRVLNNYRGICKERTYETAFLEYGIMQQLVSGTDRKMWFLHDPIEDNPHHTWKDYRYNYYKTVVASLFHPEISSYEVSPWPARVFTGKYPNEAGTDKEEMPEEYKTNLLTVMHALRDMKTEDVEWLTDTKEIGVVLSDTCMFQRFYPKGDTRHEESLTSVWNHFFGLAMPLLKSGLCVRPVQLENINRYPDYISNHKKLVLSYEFMKPENPGINNAVAQWVRNGGCLIYVGNGEDSFHKIPHWWNSRTANYDNPAEHLFESLGLSRKLKEGIYDCGSGTLAYICRSPREIALKPELCDEYLNVIKNVFANTDGSADFSPHMALRRGKYVVAASFDEQKCDLPMTLHGDFIDLFDDKLAVCHSPVISQGEEKVFIDLEHADNTLSSDILAVSGRISMLKQTQRSFSCIITGPANMKGCMRVKTKRPPKQITAKTSNKETEIVWEYDNKSETTYIEFPSSEKGVSIKAVF